MSKISFLLLFLLSFSKSLENLHGSKPNVVIFFIDDTGYGDYGFNDPNIEDTPNLDRIA